MPRTRKRAAPIISVACYKPKRGKAKQLLACVRDHIPTLRSQKLVTNRKPIVMQAADGTIVEVIEWQSEQAIADAHENAVVGRLWARFDACCTFAKFCDLAEAKSTFPGFSPVKS